jgi:hypothetical protein
MPGAMSPDAFAGLVLDAVAADEFFVCSHPEFAALVAQRNAAVVASFPEGADPDSVAAMRAMIKPF